MKDINKKIKREKLLKQLKSERVLYLMLFPTILFFIIFRVFPIFNMRLAFYKYSSRSAWTFVGLKYFKMIFSSPDFIQIIKNTLTISFMKYILLFPAFPIFAILLNELRSRRTRKAVQIISYLPHFLSWIVIAGVWISMLSVDGSVNQILHKFGLGESIDFMTSRAWIKWVLYFCEGWRSLGWDSIIYFTAIIAINPSLYEAAQIDGASRWQMIKSIILPALVVPMVTMFILNLGFFLNAGFDQVLNFSNDAVLSSIDILDTYIYRIGIQSGQYSIATAVSLIKGVVGVFLVLFTHFTSKKLTGKGVW
ncbi:MAG: ABC transporter permease [Pleomorphochaeta sp.]